MQCMNYCAEERSDCLALSVIGSENKAILGHPAITTHIHKHTNTVTHTSLTHIHTQGVCIRQKQDKKQGYHVAVWLVQWIQFQQRCQSLQQISPAASPCPVPVPPPTSVTQPISLSPGTATSLAPLQDVRFSTQRAIYSPLSQCP